MDDESDALEAYERELYQLDKSSSDEEDGKNEAEEMLYCSMHYSLQFGDKPLPSKNNSNEVKENNGDIENDSNERPEKNRKFHTRRYYDTEDLSDMKCYNCEEMGHRSRDCPNGKKMICYNCEETGHMSRDCPNAKKIICYNCQGTGHISRDCTINNIVCFNCNQIGHFSRECKEKKRCHLCNETGHFSRNCTGTKKNADTSKSKTFIDRLGDYCKDVQDMAKNCLKDKIGKKSKQKEDKNNSKKEKKDLKKSKSKKSKDSNIDSLGKEGKINTSSHNQVDLHSSLEKKLISDNAVHTKTKNLIDNDPSNNTHSNGVKENINLPHKKISSKIIKKVAVNDIIDLVSNDSDNCEVMSLDENETNDNAINKENFNLLKGYNPSLDLGMNKNHIKSKKKDVNKESKLKKDTKPSKTEKHSKVRLKEKKVFDHQATLNDLRTILRDSGDDELSDPNLIDDDDADIPNINVDDSDSEVNTDDDELFEYQSDEDVEGIFEPEFLDTDKTHYNPTDVNNEDLALYGLGSSSITLNSNTYIHSRDETRCKKTDGFNKFKAYSNSPVIKKNIRKDKKEKKIYIKKLKKHFKNAKTNNNFLQDKSPSRGASTKKKNIVHKNNDFRFLNVKKNVIFLD